MRVPNTAFAFELTAAPTDFRARTRQQGKKITAGDGFKAMFALLKHRFRTV